MTRSNDTGGEVYDHTELRDEPTDAYVSFDKRNGMVGIAFPRFLDGRKISQGTDVIRRAELGKLIADPKNEALSKAFVNRMWAHFLGRGFVNPVDDFGPHNQPSHPEVLDRLAKEFRDERLRRQEAVPVDHGEPGLSAQQRAGRRGARRRTASSAAMPLRPMTPGAALRLAADGHRRPTRPATGDDGNRRRDAWLRQFLFAFANDEAEESTSFQGTIPQALMMMNGELMQEALSGKPGSFLCEVIEHAEPHGPVARDLHGRIDLPGGPEPASRRPGSSIRPASTSTTFPDSLQVLQDLFWALLNSNEFILIH